MSIQSLTQKTLLDGVAALVDADPDLAQVIDRLGPPPLWSRQPGFPTLIHIILEQQVSLASAKAAFDRLCAAADPLTPQAFLAFDDAQLKIFGFSRQKSRYGRELARTLLSGQLDLSELPHLPDDEVRRQLTQVKGIGPWTANVYLLMVLGRPDVWPLGDLAVAVAAQEVKGLDARPDHDTLLQIAEQWRPWRAVAARILWHHYLA